MHRSGTRSVHDLFIRSGISTIHWPRIVSGINYENEVSGHESDLQYVASVLAPVIDMVTAVGDVPIAALYEQLDSAYSNSAFVLVLRNPADWIRSVRGHIGDRDLYGYERVQYWRYLLGKPPSLQKVSDAELCSAYIAHQEGVFNFFQRRDNCLVLNLLDPDCGERICRFLEIPPISLQNIASRRAYASTSPPID